MSLFLELFKEIKEIKFTVACLIIGSLCLLLGIFNGLSYKGFSLSALDLFPRIILCSVGIIILISSVLIELIKNRRLPPPTPPSEPIPVRIPDTFLETISDRKPPSMPELMAECSSFSILGRTAINLLNLYQKEIEDSSSKGCLIRFILLNPLSDACKYLTTEGTDWHTNHMISTLTHLNIISQKKCPHIQVRLIDNPPPFSMLCAEKRDSNKSQIQVQLYFLIGRNLPFFRLSFKDKWYKIFHDEFEDLWKIGKDLNILELQNQLREINNV
jgi:hypothetical protein